MNREHGFSIDDADSVLRVTPSVLRSLLEGLPQDHAAASNEGDWQPFDVLGHLIHGEETDWIPRARIILDQGDDRTFEPFDRFAQFERSRGKSLGDLLDEFTHLRAGSLDTLRSWNLTESDLDLDGVHPEFGLVTLRQLLATWVVHDLGHIRQVVTAMAKRHDGDVGPWKEYLSILG